NQVTSPDRIVATGGQVLAIQGEELVGVEGLTHAVAMHGLQQRWIHHHVAEGAVIAQEMHHAALAGAAVLVVFPRRVLVLVEVFAEGAQVAGQPHHPCVDTPTAIGFKVQTAVVRTGDGPVITEVGQRQKLALHWPPDHLRGAEFAVEVAHLRGIGRVRAFFALARIGVRAAVVAVATAERLVAPFVTVLAV
nr:hypothetical protein [Tanacetum cinerariifolium]